jgi:hypothetical protein
VGKLPSLYVKLINDVRFHLVTNETREKLSSGDNSRIFFPERAQVQWRLEASTNPAVREKLKLNECQEINFPPERREIYDYVLGEQALHGSKNPFEFVSTCPLFIAEKLLSP